ncbi:hypothetical protein PFISCL1PPCAC_15875, partial [Pristionchus fissidentatus]
KSLSGKKSIDMRLSAIRGVLTRGSDGQPQWKEISQLYFPKGGKTLTLVQRGLFVFLGCVFLGSYAHFQTTINPESKWADMVNSAMTDPARALGFDTSEADSKPKPSWASHIQ